MATKTIFDRPESSVLYLPNSFHNYSLLIGDFSPMFLHSGLVAVFCGTISDEPVTTFKKRPQTKFNLTDGRYYLRFVFFGDVRSIVEKIKECAGRVFVYGEVTLINNYPYLNNPKFIDESDAGTIKPVYPGIAGKIKPEPLAAYMEKAVRPNIAKAATTVRNVLSANFTNGQIKQLLNIPYGLTLDTVLEEIHYPTNIGFANHCLAIMNRLATVLAATEILSLAKQQGNETHAKPFAVPPFEELAKRSPFQLTDEQEGIVRRNLEKIKSGTRINALILGDVGTGKTVTYALIGGAVALAGGKIAIMLPNGNLCAQIHREFNDLFPDLKPLLVNSSETDQQKIDNASVLIGTTALLFREIKTALDLVIFDESQKLAMGQQDILTGPQTHKISVSATPIPRTMALANYGAVTIEKITKCHAVKNIYTRVLTEDQWQQMVDEILWAIQDAGKQAIVVCARKEDELDAETDNQIISVEEAFSYFSQLLPNQVVASHSGLLPEENAAALDSMRNGTAKLLVATTVIEVGVTLPDVNYLAVLNPERFGLSSLHQLRGRLARLGGDAWCSLYLNRGKKSVLNQSTINRLNILASTTDGFEIANQDMHLRGVGDLMNATAQHGKYVGLIKNAEINVADIEKIIEQF